MTPKRIVVLFDGTWNDADTGTNIARLNALVRRIPGEQVVTYRRGVGGFGERLRGGVLGLGVDREIQAGYDAVVAGYRPGDRIHLLGYSRGAFTARSLAGMIARCGIRERGAGPSTADLFAHYRRRLSPGLRELKDGEEPRTDVEKGMVEHCAVAPLRFVGVFDTVGSLGVPGAVGSLFAHRYAFHDTTLSGLVEYARHAIAIDETRASFTPTLWTNVPIPVPGIDTSVEQRWFVGSHANVGGGNLDSGDNRLADVTLDWMVRELRAAGLTVDDGPDASDAWDGAVHDSDSGVFGLLGSFVPSQRPGRRAVRQTNLFERLAPSVLTRWEKRSDYRPPNPGLRVWVRSLLSGSGGTPASTA
jgi:uncharacterized protein (DUF2235 family)